MDRTQVVDLFCPDSEYDGKPTPELIALVNDTKKSASVRFAAATAIGRRGEIPVLREIATSPQMRETRMMRLVSIAYIAAGERPPEYQRSALQAGKQVWPT